jgi:hypothetical protein
MNLRLPTSEEMALVSSGSLAAGTRELPAGVHRQYTILDIDPQKRRVTVHVREAIGDLIFAEVRRTELGGESSVKMAWSPTPMRFPPNARNTLALDNAMSAFRAGDRRRSAEILRQIPSLTGPARRLMIDVLAPDPEQLVTFIGKPETTEELVALVDALLSTGRVVQARSAMNEHKDRLGMSTDVVRELEARLLFKEARS